jgi:hypothetical protein
VTTATITPTRPAAPAPPMTPAAMAQAALAHAATFRDAPAHRDAPNGGPAFDQDLAALITRAWQAVENQAPPAPGLAGPGWGPPPYQPLLLPVPWPMPTRHPHAGAQTSP